MDQTYYLSLFLDEGRERLQQLDELLLALERNPHDSALLNDIFRTVHTFKGMADTMEFEELAALTHAMEGALDGLRQGVITLEPQMTSLLLRCLDALLQAVEDIERGRPGELKDGDALVAELEHTLVRIRTVSQETKRVEAERLAAAPPPESAPASPERPSEHSRTYRIEVTLDPHCFMKSARALMITSSLEMLGAVLDITPSLEELEWADASDVFGIVMVTEASADMLRTALGQMGEIAKATVEEQEPAPHADNLPLSPDERQSLEAALDEGRTALWVEISLMPHCRMKSVRAALAINALGAYGTALKVEPPVAELEAERTGDSFRILFLTVEDPATLRECLLHINEILTVGITPYDGLRHAAEGPLTPPETSDDAPAEPPAPSRYVSLGEAKRHRSVRIETEKLDQLMDMVTELSIRHNRLQRLSERQGPGELTELSAELAQATGLMREALMGLRLVPVETVFNRFPRMVRDLSQDLGKQVALTMAGQAISLDRLLMDELGDLLVHLLRNALDHGLEPPSERFAAGKPALGTLHLAASLEGAQVLITVADDGRGIDVARVVAAAVTRGRLSAAQAAALSPAEAIALIYEPGLSTADVATRLSGRGVGLDVVKSKIDAMGGFLRVETSLGRGTTFEIRFPIMRDYLVRPGEPVPQV